MWGSLPLVLAGVLGLMATPGLGVIYDSGRIAGPAPGASEIRDVSIVVTNGTWLQVGRAGLALHAGLIRVDQGSIIFSNADGEMGWGPGYAGYDVHGVGGSYGGRGWPGHPEAYDEPMSKPPYGTSDGLDIDPGSDGTRGHSNYDVPPWFPGFVPGGLGGKGGGAIRLEAERIEIEGQVVAQGARGEIAVGIENLYGGPGGCGSGGGILILCRDLVVGASGSITANSGYFEFPEERLGYLPPPGPGYFGGGGRIKIFYEHADIAPTAVIEAKGWEDGTVHLEQVDDIRRLGFDKYGAKSHFLTELADLNGDGTVDHQDLLLLQSQWQKNVQSATP